MCVLCVCTHAASLSHLQALGWTEMKGKRTEEEVKDEERSKRSQRGEKWQEELGLGEAFAA